MYNQRSLLKTQPCITGDLPICDVLWLLFSLVISLFVIQSTTSAKSELISVWECAFKGRRHALSVVEAASSDTFVTGIVSFSFLRVHHFFVSGKAWMMHNEAVRWWVLQEASLRLCVNSHWLQNDVGSERSGGRVCSYRAGVRLACVWARTATAESPH